MYRRIMVPVDGSATSKLGLAEALKLAQADGVALRAINVVDEGMIAAADPLPITRRTDFTEALRQAGKEALEAAAAEAARRHVKAEFAQLESGGRAVSDVILAEAKKWRADLMVMGTHGRRGLNRLLLGSDAERVLRESAVPVLLVRGEPAPSGR